VFGRRIYKEAMRRGMNSAGETVVIGDGAPWIWNIADEQFYGGTQIVDLFHAREHYWNVAEACFGKNKDMLYQWTEERRKELDDGRPEEVIDAIKRCTSFPGYDQAMCEREIGYFERTGNGCGMRILGREVSLWVPGSWRQDVEPLLDNA